MGSQLGIVTAWRCCWCEAVLSILRAIDGCGRERNRGKAGDVRDYLSLLKGTMADHDGAVTPETHSLDFTKVVSTQQGLVLSAALYIWSVSD